MWNVKRYMPGCRPAGLSPQNDDTPPSSDYGVLVSSRAPRPLLQRIRPGYWVALDCAAGVICGGLTLLAVLPVAGDRWRLLAPAAIFFAVGFRRRQPMVALAVVVAAALIGGLTSPVRILALLSPAAYVLYLVAVTRPMRTSLSALGGLVGVLAAVVMVNEWAVTPRTTASTIGPALALVMVLAWLIGHSVRQRRAHALVLREQAAASAVAEERLRIARELHDIVAHSMSVIAAQAESGPADVRPVLDSIQQTSRDALDEMRRMLGVLRHQDADGSTSDEAFFAPVSGLGDLDRLAARTRLAGVEVRLIYEGGIPPLPPVIDLCAYRVAQEALTNVVKHAGSQAECEVIVGFSDGTLSLDITDDGGHDKPASGNGAAGRAAPAGHGILGMKERVSLCGGTFSAGPLPRGGFRVTARIPLSVRTLADTAQ
jgi:signal transduction histidine kinase